MNLKNRGGYSNEKDFISYNHNLGFCVSFLLWVITKTETVTVTRTETETTTAVATNTVATTVIVVSTITETTTETTTETITSTTTKTTTNSTTSTSIVDQEFPRKAIIPEELKGLVEVRLYFNYEVEGGVIKLSYREKVINLTEDRMITGYSFSWDVKNGDKWVAGMTGSVIIPEMAFIFPGEYIIFGEMEDERPIGSVSVIGFSYTITGITWGTV
jgi:hypothetical protein